MKDKDQLLGEIRYAIRLTERTARLYRRIQSAGIFLTIIGGSAAMTSIFNSFPGWIATSGLIVTTVFAAILLTVRPADKAARNESDARKYQALMSKAIMMSEQEIMKALEEARLTDVEEIESLRDIAYNDVVLEFNRPDQLIQLSGLQRIIKELA